MNLTELLGNQSKSDNNLAGRMRLHQSWWRAFVLAEEQGQHPMKKDELIGSSILNGETSYSNFLDDYAKRAVKEELDGRGSASKGMISESRLFNNLLSSQPLCFNFFGRLKYKPELATAALKPFFPAIEQATDIHFEFAPNAAQNGDNSAHDVAIEFKTAAGKLGLIGLECKYTEPFSPKEYRNENYERLYTESDAFSATYEELTNTRYNQLFRNQLIVESAVLNKTYDLAYSGLFCFEKDDNALTKGTAFTSMLKNGEERFKIISYSALLETIQKQSIDWETREWTMLLWARYCATQLSEQLK
ncbi:PGN_0703 family putative restriction endonuclease [Mangrovibacterium diazotrophicum]|uniref:PD-(D/E)XK nuclease-like domain-containing protein n=1 Tax=Mangrovibacterium diazotrophicum TaxID=1261403 RepID=A0A419W4R6_9BACT|nr:hypothetical protein [Mangrovibacterium diazotrophicum]RKD90426.1 hypothetical protein BC643_0765 [Mangrovibacterium diazotrophicum]